MLPLSIPKKQGRLKAIEGLRPPLLSENLGLRLAPNNALITFTVPLLLCDEQANHIDYSEHLSFHTSETEGTKNTV